MKNKIIDIAEYEDKIVDVSLSKIEINPLNPRKRFVDSETDILIESILSKGLLNPIIVYKKVDDSGYVILDGERRFKAFQQLNKDKISCHILEKEPTELENLSMMFHIHNVREDWTDFAVAQTLIRIIYETGKHPKHLRKADKVELSNITSLSEYKINKYLLFFDYPENIIKKFMESEMSEYPEKGMDPDILAEMHSPLKIIKSELAEFLEKYSIENIIDACVIKKANGIIRTNRDFRLLKKSLIAMKNGNIKKEVMLYHLESFITKLEVTPQSIYEETSEAIYVLESIFKKTKILINDLQNLELNSISPDERAKLENNFNKLFNIFKNLT